MKIIDEKQPKELKISQPPEIKHSGTFNYDLAMESVDKALAESYKENLIDKIIDENKHMREYGKRLEEVVFEFAKNTSYKYAYLQHFTNRCGTKENGDVEFSVTYNFVPTDIELKTRNISGCYDLEPVREFIKKANIETIEQLRNNTSEFVRYCNEYYAKVFIKEQNKGESKHEE